MVVVDVFIGCVGFVVDKEPFDEEVVVGALLRIFVVAVLEVVVIVVAAVLVVVVDEVLDVVAAMAVVLVVVDGVLEVVAVDVGIELADTVEVIKEVAELELVDTVVGVVVAVANFVLVEVEMGLIGFCILAVVAVVPAVVGVLLA